MVWSNLCSFLNVVRMCVCVLFFSLLRFFLSSYEAKIKTKDEKKISSAYWFTVEKLLPRFKHVSENWFTYYLQSVQLKMYSINSFLLVFFFSHSLSSPCLVLLLVDFNDTRFRIAERIEGKKYETFRYTDMHTNNF